MFHSQHTIVVQRRRQTPLHSSKTPSQSRRPKPKSAKTASPTVSSIIRRRAFDVTASNPTPQRRRPLRTPKCRAPLRTEPSRRRRRLRRRRIRETVRPKSITRTQLDRPRRVATTTTTPTLVIAARMARSRSIVEAKRSLSWRSVSRRFRDFSTASLVFASSRFANNVDTEMVGWVRGWGWGWG